jgi:hypothetical protein
MYLAATGPWWQEGSTFRTLGLVAVPGLGAIVICLGMYYILNVEAFTAFVRARRSK